MRKRVTVALNIPALFSFFTAWRMVSGSARAAATLLSRKKIPGMFKHHSTFHRRLVVCLVLIAFLGLLIGLKVRSHRSDDPNTQSTAIKLQGEEATRFLETSSGSSLGQALNNERFKLSWNDRSPFGERGGGYLALSHEQNINAWFDDDGVTIRPTGSDPTDRWKFGMKLKAYGYGAHLLPAPATKNISMKGRRVEYQRQSAIGNRQPEMIEWYENRSAGIEQGFTINQRPVDASTDTLQLIISVSGDLTASVNNSGSEIKLTNTSGKQTLTYGQLSAVDANSRDLQAHLETRAEGREIVLSVDDREAAYPIVIDPITTSEQARLFPTSFEVAARFGFSVAIEGNLAIVGSPTSDESVSTADTGRVYVFNRTGSTWNFEQGFVHPTLSSPSLRCGYSVDISGGFLIYGCPGFATTKGSVIVLVRAAANSYTVFPLDSPQVDPGDRFGANVSIDGSSVLVGAPFYDLDLVQDTNDGAVFLFKIDGTHAISSAIFPGHGTPFSNNLFGTDVAIDNDGATFVVGEPNADGSQSGSTISNSGAAHIFTRNAGGTYDEQVLTAPDFAAGDQFGFTVAISGNTIAVGAPFDDNEKGTNAGSVYVFRKMNTGIWQQEAKLVASDGFANDEFSYLGLGLKNSTLVVGSHLADGPNFPFDPNENRGLAYIFTPVNNVWTEQSKVRASDGSPGDEFGFGIDLDKNSLIVGAPNDDVAGQSDAGSAYVYTLSCPSVPAPVIEVIAGNDPLIRTDSITLCEHTRAFFETEHVLGQSYQWRRNGISIPGATDSLFSRFFTAADAGTYDVVVSNSCSSRTSPPIVVNVRPGCDVTPLSQTLPSTAGGGALNVTACPTCYWGVTIFVNQTSIGFNLVNFGGRGNGPLDFTVSRNPNTNIRSVEYEVVGKRALIIQDSSPNLFVTDSGTGTNSGSLIDAINFANQTPGDDLVTFELPGPGPHVISTTRTLSITSNIKFVNDRIGDEPITIQRDPASSNAFRLFQVESSAHTLIAGLTISKGQASDAGGGLANLGGKVILRNCTFSLNASDGGGGAIFNDGGIMQIDNCTFSQNSATIATAGAIFNRSVQGNGVITVSNSTFSGNASQNAGAIQNGTTVDGPAYLALRNCTFAANNGTSASAIINHSFLTSINTVFVRGIGNGNIANTGTFTSLGHNLTNDSAGGDAGTGPGGALNGTGDIRNTNPNLGPLTNNGGLTTTQALIAPSAAINGGDDSLLSAPFNLLSDQRGFLRKAGSSVDIGAFESGTTAGSAVQFSSLNYSGSEAAGRIDLIVSRTGDSSAPVNISYATTDKGGGNSCDAVSEFASSRCDYISALGTVRLNPGETSKIISVLVIDDVIPENSEKFAIEITDVKGARIGPQNSAEVTITDNETTNLPNPLSQPIFFVRQHYLDFLNREPDSSGLNFWSNEIASCGSNQQCIEVKRVNVSAAFFLSIEFQETGYLVYRAYKVGFGNLTGKPVPVRLNDFLRDTQEIGKNVVVGTPGWQAQLESNKQAFALAFVNRPEFIASFANALTADQFVTQMNNNAGGVLSASEKANLVALLGSTPFDPAKRAQVLRAVADDQDLRNAEFNKAFVLMQYFGYLRRNPNDLPDLDFSGYNFWLGKLNQFNGNFVNAEMVKSFIVSGEYQHRFGP